MIEAHRQTTNVCNVNLTKLSIVMHIVTRCEASAPIHDALRVHFDCPLLAVPLPNWLNSVQTGVIVKTSWFTRGVQKTVIL